MKHRKLGHTGPPWPGVTGLAAGDVWVSYDDPAYLAARHAVTDRADTLNVLSRVLEGLVSSVATPGG